ncbi:MAG: AAA family ATPase [Paludibacteraceae bacterium]|nr:AAA family ATPase [Paludibacteraceae bacterium]
MAIIVGREQEIRELHDLYNSDRAQLVAVYGRRRVGKTFLIDEALKGKITFRHAGLSPVEQDGKRNLMPDQLKHFYHSLLLQGMRKSHIPESWLDAFFMLSQHLQNTDNGSRQVVFLDELPWMDTPRSGFITAFEGFWNNWACHRDNVMVVVCGSASSWILDKLINNHGGLYDRVTHEMHLHPFTLRECEQFLKTRHIRMTRYDIVQSYMMLGGIPYYLNYFQPENSLAQNVDRLFFNQQAKLHNEYDRLFTSVFTDAETMRRIVDFLGTRHKGFTRAEILAHLGLEDSGSFSDKLKALESSDFVMSYVPFGESKRNKHYKLIDPFCLFFQRYVRDHGQMESDFWTNHQCSQSVISWRGVAFEEVCLIHIDAIKQALGIAGVGSEQSAWSVPGDEEREGVQIDLIIARKDNVVNMCEMKFYGEEFEVDKSYHNRLMRRQNVLLSAVNRKTAIHSTLITTYGLKYNEYSGDFVKVITLDDLFKE